MTRNDAIEHIGDLGRPHRRDDLQIEEIDGEAIIYDPHNGAVHRFNETTFFIWNGCDGSQTPTDIARALSQAYAIDGDQAASHVHDTIERFRDRELLSVEQSATLFSRDVQPRQVIDFTACDDSRGLSRREFIEGGVTKAVLAAPVISTFFAAGAFASGPSASAAFGTGGCKNIGYSCAVAGDCCDNPSVTDCEGGTCCIQVNKTGCVNDSQCCSAAASGCVAGTCTP